MKPKARVKVRTRAKTGAKARARAETGAKAVEDEEGKGAVRNLPLRE